jgi:hypothetical protein
LNAKDRAEYIQSFIEKHCFGVMGTKGVEYSRGEEDANSNFRRTALAMGVTPEQVNRIFGKKHEDAIDYAVKTDNFEGSEPIEERIGDAINYLLILASLIEQRRRNNPVEGPKPSIHHTTPPIEGFKQAAREVCSVCNRAYSNHTHEEIRACFNQHPGKVTRLAP